MFSIADLQRAARRRLPRMIYDFIEGGAGDETALERNITAWGDIRLVPRVLTECASRNLGTEFLGRSYAAPFGISPMGLGNVAWPGTDLGLARALGAARLPYCLSTAGSTAIEPIAKAADGYLWFQLYLGPGKQLGDDLMARAAACGVETLIFTVDANVPAIRLRDRRHRIAMPLQLRPGILADLALHPRWSLATARAGAPGFGVLEKYASGPGGNLKTMLAAMAASRIVWDDLAHIRDSWRGRLIVKGVMNPEDALRCRQMGADAVMVSNHGGRQLASVLSSIEALPGMRQAVGPEYPLLIDSGARSGEDVVRALALGANFVLMGRPFLFASAALGPDAGGRAIIDIVRAEIDVTMGQLGLASIGEIGPDCVHRAPPRNY